MPAGDSTSVDVVGMGQARTRFENAASTFTRQLGLVDDEADSLRSTWTGSGSAQFGSAMDDWASDFAVVVEELRAVAEAMGGGSAPGPPRPSALER
ncbi:MAG: WXG100 family type VII secretion target [Umezawaea sp.]